MEPIERAIEILGTPSALAAALGVTPQVVSNWRARKSIPPDRVLTIEAATGGKVTRHELRPDLYPKERNKQGKAVA